MSEKILNNLEVGEILYTTNRGTNYKFIKLKEDCSVVYSIKNWRKNLPIKTIKAAIKATNNNLEINSKWYKNFNTKEYLSRPCNLKVLQNLIKLNKV